MYEAVDKKTLLSCAKSALQKHVRRGEVIGAGCAARIMAGADLDSLIRRMHIVIVEDAAYCLGFATRVESDPVGVAMNLASRPMSKDFLHLISLNRTVPLKGGIPELEVALRERRMWDAAQIASSMFVGGQKKELLGFFRGAIRTKTEGTPALCERVDVAEPLVVRLGQGTFWGDDSTLLIGGICAAFCGKVETPEWTEFPKDFLDESFAKYRFPWYALDTHTPPGRAAMTVLKRNRELPKNILTLMFWGMSAKFGRCDHRVWTLEQCLKEEGEELDALNKSWASYEEEYKKYIVWASKKILGEPPSVGGK